MTAALLLTVTLSVPGAAPQSAFEVQTALQALYDEMIDGAPQFMTPADVDLFRDVLYAPGFVFIDTAGHRHDWPALRRQQVSAIGAPLPDSSFQAIQKLTLAQNGATAIVTRTTVRTMVDEDGCYGRRGASHTLTDVTPFRDQWIRTGEGWRLLSRTQIGKTTVGVDKHEWGL